MLFLTLWCISFKRASFSWRAAIIFSSALLRSVISRMTMLVLSFALAVLENRRRYFTGERRAVLAKSGKLTGKTSCAIPLLERLRKPGIAVHREDRFCRHSVYRPPFSRTCGRPPDWRSLWPRSVPSAIPRPCCFQTTAGTVLRFPEGRSPPGVCASISASSSRFVFSSPSILCSSFRIRTSLYSLRITTCPPSVFSARPISLFAQCRECLRSGAEIHPVPSA